MSDEKTDIVERLRDEGFITHMSRLPRESKILQKAADEIERLRAELAAMRKQRDDARRWLRDACAEIARIETRFYDALPPQQIAERNGWTCFAQQEGGGA